MLTKSLSVVDPAACTLHQPCTGPRPDTRPVSHCSHRGFARGPLIRTFVNRVPKGSRHNLLPIVRCIAPRRICVAAGVQHSNHDQSTQLPQSFPTLPLGLLTGLTAAWVVTARSSLVTQCRTLLLLDIVYAGLHMQPLLPLFQRKSSPDVAFMQCYTRACYFVSECLLLGWLFTNSVIRASIPSIVLALHGAVHIFFVVLADRAPAWCMQQQVQRIQNGWSMTGLVGIWHVLVNMVNFTDLFLHACYIKVLWQGSANMAHASAMVTTLWHAPLAVASIGLLLAYCMAQWLPHWQYKQHESETS